MTKTYAIVDNSTDVILKFGLCADSDLNLQPQTGQTVIDVTGSIDWLSDQNLYTYNPTTKAITHV